MTISKINAPILNAIDRLMEEFEHPSSEGIEVSETPIYEVGPLDDFDDIDDDRPHAIHLDYATSFRELQRMGLADDDGFTREPMRRMGGFDDWDD